MPDALGTSLGVVRLECLCETDSDAAVRAGYLLF